MKRAVVAVAVAALSGCGGGGAGGGGAGEPNDVLACLKDEHGLRAVFGAKNAGSATTTIEVAIGEPPNSVPVPTFPPILYLDFFPDAEGADSYVGGGPVGGYARRRVADTVTANYNAAWGLAGPPQLKDVEDCVG
jgi:hypothetical protein